MAKGLDLVSGKAATASSAGSGADADQASRVGGFGDGGGALYASGRSGDPWAPRGVLVAHLAEHAAPVRALTSSADGLFFVSGGDDGACKLWDCARLERDVSFRSRLTYASQGGRITALCAGVTGDDHAVASASDQGAVHVWRVEYVERKKTGAPVSVGDRGGEDAGAPGDSAGAPQTSSFPPRNKKKPPSVERYTGAAEIRQRADGDGAVLCLERVSPNVLCFATARGGFRGWDLRAPGARDAFRVTLPPRLGVATRCASEPHSFFARDGDGSGSHRSSAAGSSTPRWFVFGTSAGCVALADARFGAIAAEWRLPGGASHAVEALALDPTRARDRTPLAWVAHGPDEVALWDVARGELRAAAEVAGRRGIRRGEDADNERDADERAGPGDEEGAWELATFSFAHNEGILEPWVHASAFDWASTTDHAFASPDDENGEGEGEDSASRTPASREATKKSARAAETRLERDFRVAELGDAPANVGGAKCVLPLPSGAVLTGGADACVRLWCPGDANRGRVVHGPLPPGAGRAPRHEERAVTVGGRVARVMREPRNAAGNAPGVAEAKANAAARHDCHRDAVLAMEAVGVGTGRALVTAGRDAAVKVWK